MAKGYLCLVLHAHLPFVRHPEHEDFLEEHWLFEALTESYVPLIDIFHGLARDGVRWKLTMSLTPTLCAMLGDELLGQRFLRYLGRSIELAEKELTRTAALAEFAETAQMYHARLLRVRELFEHRYGGRILNAFKEFAESGNLELITCSATHGFLPVLRQQEKAVRAQILVGVQSFKNTFGWAPKGIWNAECGFFPGVDAYLKEAGISYFFVDSHGLLFANKRPRYGVFAPIQTPLGVSAFARDVESSRSVWSAAEGYPGDPRYREYYRDIGFDLDLDYIRPYIHESGIRTATGIKYYRISGTRDLHDKQPYRRAEALQAADEHAADFLFNRQHQSLHLASLMDRPPIIVAPYDAELFGHWWYEGPEFLDRLIRRTAEQDDIELITPSGYLERYPRNQVAMPSLSSWGNNGYSEVWIDQSNDWIYRHLHKAAERMQQLVARFPDPTPVQQRALNQALRELLLAQSSDWAFIMKMKTMVNYAERRTREHLHRFNTIYDQLMAGVIDEVVLEDYEYKDNIFPKIDVSVFA
ncbi:MAG: 1,4-alpha-glucan branching protein domain-containing protein [Candidatus Sumerlaeia bacterium]|nr:1,4-alpha-glucan branching protein domain-containing protein [Candidatus Sumerlaeia bacterium]